jgi:hypothetical protein
MISADEYVSEVSFNTNPAVPREKKAEQNSQGEAVALRRTLPTPAAAAEECGGVQRGHRDGSYQPGSDRRERGRRVKSNGSVEGGGGLVLLLRRRRRRTVGEAQGRDLLGEVRGGGGGRRRPGAGQRAPDPPQPAAHHARQPAFRDRR